MTETNLEHIRTLDDLHETCRRCRGCGLAATRQTVVFGEGNRRAKIFFLGEAPGAQEDQSGRPFVGRAGDLLNQLLAAAGIYRADVYITGSLKCRPPRNRNPRRDELVSCRPYLDKQLALIRPEIVVCLGLIAVRNILDPGAKLADVRGRWFERSGYRIFPTYHPAAALRRTVSAALIIEDLRAVSLART